MVLLGIKGLCVLSLRESCEPYARRGSIAEREMAVRLALGAIALAA